jgi:acyl-CoA reductase-like NAD-dependent aldehyde dehydrogenase
MTSTNENPTSVSEEQRSEIGCSNPATREKLGTIPVDDVASVERKINLAREAQREWSATSFEARAKLLHRLCDRMLDDADMIVDWVVQDSGKTRENALMGEIWPVCDKIRWTAKNGAKHLKPERVRSGTLLHKSARIEYPPAGVVGAILPWNYPFQNLLNPLIPALMAGNAVVLKPSEWVAWSSERIVAWVREIVADAGYSPELVQIAQGYGATGEAVIRGGTDVLLFIGSGRNGQRVLETAAERFVPVILELGGKDPLVVCNDANLQHAVDSSISGCFINCGQNCVAAERILVHRAVAEEFEARAAKRVGELRQGVSTESQTVDVGAMITPLQLEQVEQLVEEAIEEGARLVAGGKRTHEETGDFYAPTILADVTPDMTIMHEEVFGPVMLIAPVNDDEHAIEVANGTAFGLGASVFSRDKSRARRIADRIESGMVTINDFGGMSYMAQGLPFGGVKASGYGRMNGREGLRSFTNPRAVLEDRFPFSVPARVMPVDDDTYETQRVAMRAVYGRSLWERLSAALNLAKSKLFQ